MRFDFDMYNKIYPREVEQPEVVPQEDKMVEDVEEPITPQKPQEDTMIPQIKEEVVENDNDLRGNADNPSE